MWMSSCFTVWDPCRHMNSWTDLSDSTSKTVSESYMAVLTFSHTDLHWSAHYINPPNISHIVSQRLSKFGNGVPCHFVRPLQIFFSVTLYRNFNARFDFYGKGRSYTGRLQIRISNSDRTVLDVNQYQTSLNFSVLFCRPNIDISRSLRAKKHKHIERQGGKTYSKKYFRKEYPFFSKRKCYISLTCSIEFSDANTAHEMILLVSLVTADETWDVPNFSFFFSRE
jgi:hypothetical protein